MNERLPTKVSESVRKLNPHLYPALGGLVAGKREQASLCSLDKGIQKREKGKGSVEVVVSLITARSRELDDDGNVAALKPLRDAIAESLGLDDADKRIRFEYSQCETRGKHGVIVKIEMLDNPAKPAKMDTLLETI